MRLSSTQVHEAFVDFEFEEASGRLFLKLRVKTEFHEK